MAFSIYETTGDGITTQYNFGFPYLETEDVFVFVDGIELVQGLPPSFIGQTEDYYIEEGTSVVTFIVAPADQSQIKIQRSTPIDVPVVELFEQAVLNPDDVELDNLQQLYKIQEISDLLEQNINSFAGNNQMNQNLDMNSNRIINLGDAVTNTDALNYGQAQQLIADFEAPVIEYVVNGIGYKVGQTPLSGRDLTLETAGGVEFIARTNTVQILQSSYTAFDAATNQKYDIGGGILELPAIVSPDAYQEYYTRLK